MAKEFQKERFIISKNIIDCDNRIITKAIEQSEIEIKRKV